MRLSTSGLISSLQTRLLLRILPQMPIAIFLTQTLANWWDWYVGVKPEMVVVDTTQRLLSDLYESGWLVTVQFRIWTLSPAFSEEGTFEVVAKDRGETLNPRVWLVSSSQMKPKITIWKMIIYLELNVYSAGGGSSSLSNLILINSLSDWLQCTLSWSFLVLAHLLQLLSSPTLV